MKDLIDKASTAIILASSAAMLFIVFYAPDGRRSFWLVPLCFLSIAAHFFSNAFGKDQLLLPKHASFPKSASKGLFWFYLTATIAVTVMAAQGGT
jgi:uncharacterized membrane protein YhaH (DUF805 family)